MKQLWWNPKFLAVLLLVAAVVYLWASSPDKVVIRTDGSIIGIQNDVREALQGEHFWIDQRYLAYRERESLRKQPEQDHKLRSEVDRIIQESRRSMEQFYRENPSARPSKATIQAEALRSMAERVEEAEMWRLLDEHRRERMQELEQLQGIADRKVKQQTLAPQ